MREKKQPDSYGRCRFRRWRHGPNLCVYLDVFVGRYQTFVGVFVGDQGLLIAGVEKFDALSLCTLVYSYGSECWNTNTTLLCIYIMYVLNKGHVSKINLI